MSSKINISSIVKAHFSTYKDQNNNKYDLMDILTFIVLPIFISIFLVFVLKFNLFEYKEMIRSLVGGLAIFVGLLFNALVMIINIFRTSQKDDVIKNDVIKELIANISFSILIAFIATILILFRFWDFENLELAYRVFDCFILILLSKFFLTFLMVLKRTFAVIKK